MQEENNAAAPAPAPTPAAKQPIKTPLLHARRKRRAIIIGVIAALLIIGAIIAVVLLNKKEESKTGTDQEPSQATIWDDDTKPFDASDYSKKELIDLTLRYSDISITVQLPKEMPIMDLQYYTKEGEFVQTDSLWKNTSDEYPLEEGDMIRTIGFYGLFKDKDATKPQTTTLRIETVTSLSVYGTYNAETYQDRELHFYENACIEAVYQINDRFVLVVRNESAPDTEDNKDIVRELVKTMKIEGA